jgi:hypothetical protein
MKYNGSIQVKPKEIFVNKGSIITGIGRAQVNNFYLTDYSEHLPKYRGNAQVQDLNTSVITKNKQVGLLSGNFQVDGQSFDVNNMILHTKSMVSSVEIAGKKINNIALQGTLDHKKYLGKININDPYAQLWVNGLIDFSTPKLKANIESNIQQLQLNHFTNTSTPQVISGSLKGNISMTNLNDLQLETSIDHLSVYNGKEKILIPASQIKIYTDNQNKVIAVNAPSVIQGEIRGKFNLSDLGGMMQNSWNKILVGTPIRKLYRGQYFDANFTLQQNIINYFAPQLKISQDTHILAKYDGNTNNILLNAQAESLKYLMTKTEDPTEAELELAKQNPNYHPKSKMVKDSIMARNINIDIDTSKPQDYIAANIGELLIGENNFHNIRLNAENEDDKNLHIVTQFQMQNAEKEEKEYKIAFDQTTNSNGDFVFRFEPTQIEYKNVLWSIDTNHDMEHSITYKRANGEIDVKNLKIHSDESELVINRFNFQSTKQYDADVEVQHLDISKILQMITDKAPDIQGVADGSLKIKMDKNTIKPLIDVNFDQLKMNGKEMGDVDINIVDSDKPNIYLVTSHVKRAQLLGSNPLDITGTIDNTGKKALLDLSANLSDFELGFANTFVKGIFSNLRGKANGLIKITGPLDDIDYSGDVNLKGFGLKLDFTGVDYSMDDCVINLSKGLAILNDIGVKDGRKNSKGTISGAIQFQTLSSMGVNLVMRADNLLMLNSTQKDSDLFWGIVYGQGTLFVDGPVSGLNISTPDMRALNNSMFTFNSASASSSVDEFKLLRFLKTNEQGTLAEETKKKSGANMNVDFNMIVDKGTTVNVLVGDDVGDISVRGSSTGLKFKMSRQNTIEMDGTYVVDNGTFVSKEILNRTFQIVKGSSIRWDGEAMTPQLDIQANYPAMVTNTGAYLGMSSIPPIKLLLETDITGTLNKPKLDFGISAPDTSTQVKEALAAKVNQKDEKVIQFGSILVLNNFNVQNSAFDIGSMGNLAESSGYNLIFKQLSSVLNTISNQVQIDLNYVKGDQASQIGDRANAGVNFSVSPRVTIKTGMGIPISKGTANATANYLSAEGTLEYDASRKNDGSFVIRGYSKPSNIGMLGSGVSNGMANQTYGAGVVWTKSFQHLFKKDKTKQKNNISKDDKSHIPTKDSIKKDSLK